MSAGAGTRKIEYGAETVLDLEVAEDAKPDARGDTQVALKLAKNRAGQAGRTIRLLFNGALQRFREDVQ
jgi:replicative DNA helicase